MNIQEAREKIREAKAKNSNTLNLSPYQGKKQFNKGRLTSDDLNKLLPEIKELTALSVLDLGGNRISNIKFIAQLNGLTKLHLNHNEILDTEPLAQLTQLTILDLRCNEINSIESLSQLKQLRELHSSVNKITNIEPLSQLTRLKKLNLHNNQISNLKPLALLKNLKELHIGLNRIDNFEVLRQLTQLEALSLNDSQISNIKFLEQLSKLENLWLNDSQIRDFESLAQLTRLEALYLRNSQISNIEFLEQLPELKSVDLSQNHISNIEVLARLTNLISLALNNSQLNNIDFLAQLTEIRFLELRQNHISNIEILARLTKLEELDLDFNQINNIETLTDLTKLVKVDLKGNPIENPPPAIVKQGIKAIKKYFTDNARQKYKPVYETKVLIVGETETGKTTLFNKLLDPKYLPSKAAKAKKESTVGINIKTWEFPCTNSSQETIKANLWDFGGQEIQYTLHQYFLTKSSFYIFLISNRVGDNEKIHKADYWFKVISALGKDCPVLVILNERNDKSANTFDINKYVKQFGANLGAIEKIDVDFDKNDHRWDYLLETLKRKISNLPHIGEDTTEEKKRNFKKGLPEKWIAIREELETLAATNNYIKRSIYDKICQRIGVYENPEGKKKGEILSQDLLLRFLHNLGVIINFEDALLRNYLILNPNWLTKSLYLALENKTVKDKLSGNITSRFIEELWKSKSYSDEDYLILLNLMLKDNFEIAYKVEGKEDDYVIPMLLPDVRRSSFSGHKTLTAPSIYFSTVAAFQTPAGFCNPNSNAV